jgi:oxygen-independent coproporphyrinogen-3 oxidase
LGELAKPNIALPEKCRAQRHALLVGLATVQLNPTDALFTTERWRNLMSLAQAQCEACRADAPKVSDEDLNDDLKKFLTLDVDHIATYALTIHPNTVFGIQKLKPVSDDVSRRHYETIYHTLLDEGYERYEVSNFARNKDYARHNLTYWRNQEYIGCGLGASGYLHGVRYTNTKNMTKYLQGVRRDQEEVIDLTMKRFEFLMLNLRLNEGFSLSTFQEEFQQTFEVTYEKNLPALIEKKLLTIEENRVRLTFEGMLLLDYVLLKLTKDTI